jgi:hypothetical protein
MAAICFSFKTKRNREKNESTAKEYAPTKCRTINKHKEVDARTFLYKIS